MFPILTDVVRVKNMEEKDFEGLKKLDGMVRVPSEWQLLGYREVKTKKGDTYRILEFDRPSEQPIGLFSHSVEKRPDGWYVRQDHATRQADEARKNSK